ncbi:MAG: ABC transporter ATP-binding protein [Alphaproteobacteria bacterium]|nr:ABC transporter ATP-binding protein [Alphaproteobacteria bacterium]
MTGRIVAGLEGVAKAFGGLRAVDGVSLDIPAGEVVGIIGPNGAGKTVLINLITGFYHASDGQITIADHNVTQWTLHQIGRLGVARTFQNIRLFRRLSVLENVMVANPAFTAHPLRGLLALSPRRQGRDEAMDLLALFGLADRADQSAGELAYGDARRLEIARALATRPRLLLLDEPAAGMNDRETEALVDDIRKVKPRLEAIALIEHDMSLIRALADRVVAMNYGRIIAEGATGTVLSHPKVVEAYLGQEES